MVDLNEVLQLWGGGGHPAAAAASIKLEAIQLGALKHEHGPLKHEDGVVKHEALKHDGLGTADPERLAVLTADGGEHAVGGGAGAELVGGGGGAKPHFWTLRPPPTVKSAAEVAEAVMDEAVVAVLAQIPEQVRAEELMTKTVCACRPTDSMAHVLALMNRVERKSLPVVDDDGRIVGFLKYRDPIKAVQDGKGSQQAKAWMRCEFVVVSADTAFTQLEQLLIEKATGRLYVLDDERRLLGLVTRTDLLRHHQLYEGMQRRVA